MDYRGLCLWWKFPVVVASVTEPLSLFVCSFLRQAALVSGGKPGAPPLRPGQTGQGVEEVSLVTGAGEPTRWNVRWTVRLVSASTRFVGGEPWYKWRGMLQPPSWLLCSGCLGHLTFIEERKVKQWCGCCCVWLLVVKHHVWYLYIAIVHRLTGLIVFSLLLCLMMMSTPGSPHIVDGSRLSDVQHPRPAAATPITPAHKSAPRHGSLHTSQHYIADDTSIIIKETVCSSICMDHSTLPSTT